MSRASRRVSLDSRAAVVEPGQHELVSDSFESGVAYCVVCRTALSGPGAPTKWFSGPVQSLKCHLCSISLHRSCAASLTRNCGADRSHSWQFSSFVFSEEPNLRCAVCLAPFTPAEHTLYRCTRCLAKAHPHCRAAAAPCAPPNYASVPRELLVDDGAPPVGAPMVPAMTMMMPPPTMATVSTREALFSGVVVPPRKSAATPAELMTYVLSIPCPIETKLEARRRTLVFHNMQLVVQASIDEFETQFLEHMWGALEPIHEQRVLAGVEFDAFFNRALAVRRAVLTAEQVAALELRLNFVSHSCGATARLPPSQALLVRSCAADFLDGLRLLRTDPDSSIIGLRASSLATASALSAAIRAPAVAAGGAAARVPPLLPAWLSIAVPVSSDEWRASVLRLGTLPDASADSAQMAARLRGVAQLRPGDVALLRVSFSPVTNESAEGAVAATMVFVRLIAWRSNGALVCAGIGRRLLLVDPVALFGVPFDINDALRRRPSTIERYIDSAVDVAFRVASAAVLAEARRFVQRRGVDVDVLALLEPTPTPPVHPLLSSLGVSAPPANLSSRTQSDVHVQLAPPQMRALRKSIEPLTSLSRAAVLPAQFLNLISAAAANAVERTFGGALNSGWAALETASDRFVPSTAANGSFKGEPIARMFISQSLMLATRTLERLRTDMDDALGSGQLHKDINNWYLRAIETAVPNFLVSIGYDANAVPAEYTSRAPSSLFATRRNLRLVHEVLSVKHDRHSFTQLQFSLSRLIYSRLDSYALLLCCAIDDRVGATAEWFPPTAELTVDLVKGMLARASDDDVRRAVKELLYLVEMRYLEDLKTTERGELSQIVPVTGLIVGHLSRLDNELRTVLSVFDPTFDQSALIRAVTDEPAPEYVDLLLADDADDDDVADDSPRLAAPPKPAVMRGRSLRPPGSGSSSSSSLPTITFSLESRTGSRATVFQELAPTSAWLAADAITPQDELELAQKLALWQRLSST